MTDTATISTTAIQNKIGATLARAAVKSLPVHTFQTGKLGHNVRARVTINGKPAYVSAQVVFLDPKPAKAKPVAKKAPAKKAAAKVTKVGVTLTK